MMAMIKSKLAEPIYRHIVENPGCKVCQIAQAIEKPRGLVANSLAALESNGLLVAEDCDGRLFPFPFEEVDE